MFSKAYDTCWRYGILRKLKQWKIDGRILQFIKNFMLNRKLRIAVGNYFWNPKEIKNGVEQGAVLSVALFLIADIVKEIKATCKILGYTDDWVIVASSNAPIRAEFRIKGQETASRGGQANITRKDKDHADPQKEVTNRMKH
jgi:hypothetical protein